MAILSLPCVGIAAAAVSLVVGAASAGGFECPSPQPTAEFGVIKETPAEIAELAPLLAGKNTAYELPKAAKALQARYPSASSAAIANYLITAYCPTVKATPDLTDDRKTAAMKAFADQVLKTLY